MVQGGLPMLLDIEPKSQVSIWQQIVNQVTSAIASGALEQGTPIPRVREVAGLHQINPNTVAKAYQELQRRGVVEARRGMGMEVTADARDSCRLERQKIVRDRIRQALREAVSSALSP